MHRSFIQWLRRWTSPARSRPRRPIRFQRPLLETLEDRTLFSASAPFTLPTVNATPGASQFNTSVTNASYFSGVNIPGLSITVGGITDVTIPLGFTSIDLGNYGAQATLAINPSQLGIQYDASLDSGTVASSYGGVLTQNYTEPTGFDQTVVFDPSNTSFAVNNPQFTTTNPNLTLDANMICNLGGSVSGEVAYGFGSASGSASFGVNLNLPLAGYSSSSGFSIFGLPISDIFGVPSEPTLPYTTPIDFPVKPTPPPPFAYLQLNLSATPQASLLGSLNLELTPTPESDANSILDNVKGLVTGYFTPTVTEALGTAEIDNLNLTLSSGTAQTNGVVSASCAGQLAAIGIQEGVPLSLLGLTGLSNDTLSFAGATVTFTPLSFLMTGSLQAVQTASLTINPALIYQFSDSQGLPLAVPVTLNGVFQGDVDSISFVPGKDTVGIGFTDQPITVTPTLGVAASFSNELDLDAALSGTLTVLELKGSAFDQSFDFGPLYQQTYDLGMAKLATLAQDSFDLPGMDQDISLPQFTIGSTVHPDLNVTQTTDDFKSDIPGTLSFAVASANVLAAQGVPNSTIYLGANTYNFMPPSASVCSER